MINEFCRAFRHWARITWRTAGVNDHGPLVVGRAVSQDLHSQIRRLIPLHLLLQTKCKRLCAELVVEEVPEGDILFHRGEMATDWVYLLQGRVALEAGDIVMEEIDGNSDAARFPLAHQVPRKVTARALTPLRCIRIDHQRLKTMEREEIEVTETSKKEGSSEDWLTRLLKNPVFQRLPANNLQRILQRLEEMEVEAGTCVIRQGEIAEDLYIIRSGKAEVDRRPRPQARKIKLGVLHPGDMFGEDALLSGELRAVNVTMATDGVVLRLGRDDFLKLIVEPVLVRSSLESAFREVEQGAVWLDVRDSDSYRQRHIEGSINVPFFSLRMQLAGLERHRKYIAVCDTGKLGAAAAFLLLCRGFKAAVLEGGLGCVPDQCLVGEMGGAATAESETSREEQATTGGNSFELEERPLRAELEVLRQQNRSLRQTLAEQEGELVSAKNRMEKLQWEKEALEEEAATLRQRVAELEEAIRRYGETAVGEDAGKVIEALQTELEVIREQADADVAALRRRIRELEEWQAKGSQVESSRLPGELVAVYPDQLPLQPPEPGGNEASGTNRATALSWFLVGVLTSLAGLGMGIQTETGRQWLLSWLVGGAGMPVLGGVPEPTGSKPNSADEALFADQPEYRNETLPGPQDPGGMKEDDLFAE